MSATTYTVATSVGDVAGHRHRARAGRPGSAAARRRRPDSVAGFADLLAARYPLRVLTPVNPGFGGTPRPAQLDSMGKLAEVYVRLLAQLGLTGVTVVGSSIGGWVAAEVALGAGGRTGRLVLVDAAGLDSAEHPVADFFSLTLDQVADLSYAHPDAHRIDLSAMTDAQRAVAAGNRAALEIYGGRSMADPGLAARLADLTVPTLVVWGEADRMMTPAYGKEYAAAIPGAEFHLVRDAGHLPQIEAPETLLVLVGQFTGAAQT